MQFCVLLITVRISNLFYILTIELYKSIIVPHNWFPTHCTATVASSLSYYSQFCNFSVWETVTATYQAVNFQTDRYKHFLLPVLSLALTGARSLDQRKLDNKPFYKMPPCIFPLAWEQSVGSPHQLTSIKEKIWTHTHIHLYSPNRPGKSSSVWNNPINRLYDLQSSTSKCFAMMLIFRTESLELSYCIIYSLNSKLNQA